MTTPKAFDKTTTLLPPARVYVRAWCARAGLSINRLQKLTGVARQTPMRWESGKARQVGLEQLALIAHVFSIPVWALWMTPDEYDVIRRALDAAQTEDGGTENGNADC